MQKQDEITIFLCGDVMTGRGIDQILSHPNPPEIFEPYVQDARDYIKISEQVSGAIPFPVKDSYIWGDALAEFDRLSPDLKLINLETAITSAEEPYAKGINYRMHPRNMGCLTAAGINGCSLANNHVLDWGEEGLKETMAVLKKAGIQYAGAGRNLEAAEAPAIFTVPDKGRVLFFSVGLPESGIPLDWAAGTQEPGVAFLPDVNEASIERVESMVRKFKEADDLVILSIHWGDNWGHGISEAERNFAHAVIDRAGVDLIHGHSSHHPKGIEIYDGKPIFYGCGDFLNDYEGISGHKEFRGELGFMYFATFSVADRTLQRLELLPTHIQKLQVRHASQSDAHWLELMLRRESFKLGTLLEFNEAHILTARAA
ncbi:MAG: CapA family protein [Bdellovibrionota bacterium]